MRTCFLLLLGLTVLCTPEASAQERWYTVVRGDPAEISFDTTTIQDRGGENFAVWMRLLYKSPRPLLGMDKTYRQVKYRVILDCNNTRYKFLQAVYYDRGGNVVSSWEGNEASEDWQSPIPDSIGEDILSACEKRSVLNGTYARAVADWKAALDDIAVQRKQLCDTADEAQLVKACRTWFAYHAQPLRSLSKKNARAWQVANQMLDSAFALTYPRFPSSP